MARRRGDKDFTNSEKNVLMSLINDYEVCGFTDLEIMKLLSQKLNRKVGNTTFYRLRKEANKNKLNSEQWLDKFVRFELFEFYRKRIEEVKLVQKHLVKLFVQEASKKEEEKDSNIQNKQLMNQLAKTINDNSKILSEMGMGPPFLAKLQSMIPKELLEGNLEYMEKHFDKMDKDRKFLWTGNSKLDDEDDDKGEMIKLNPCDAETALLPPIDNMIKQHSRPNGGEGERETASLSDEKGEGGEEEEATAQGDQRIF